MDVEGPARAVEATRAIIERDVRAWTGDDGVLVELAHEPGRIVLVSADVERLRAAVARLVALGCHDEGLARCDAGPPRVYRRVVRVTSHPGERRPGLGVNAAP